MTDFISVRVATLRELFSGAYRFELPWFQRAYAWDTDEVGRLLTHVMDASRSGPQLKPYFLGTLVIAKEPEESGTALIDGQQRIMTLTILFAVLRDLETDARRKEEIHGLVAGRDGLILAPQDSCAQFCRQFVQEMGATDLAFELDKEELSEAELHILENRDHLRSQLGERIATASARSDFFLYLADRCHVVIHAFREGEEAWRWLQREEETQHRLNAADKAKTSLTLAMPQRDRETAGLMWDECEALLGGDDLFELLRHLRLLKRRKSSAKPVEAEVAKEFGLNKGGLAFMEQQLVPAAKRLAAIRSHEIGSGDKALHIAHAIERTSWIDEQVWLPAAFQWLSVRGEESVESALFFKRLERLVWLMRLSGLDAPKKEERIIKLLADIEAGVSVEAMKGFGVEGLRSGTLKALRGDAFDRKHFARPVLRLASLARGQDASTFDASDDTNEHIFPQGKGGRAPWRADFPQKADGVAHRLGNMTLLSKDDNRKVANRPWLEKREVYASSRFVLSREIATLPRWTPAAVQERTERLIQVLLAYWQMS